ncbi:MAG TPA: UDP-N-acetylmuramate dehydrogenase, partial [Bacillota bacterium]|nr:UDP-N-acetylmuramate dehydrogenase [Bacillota bacterium]
MNTDRIYRVLLKNMGAGQLVKDAPMHEYTSFKAGGKAALLVLPENIAQLRYTMKTISEEQAPYFIMGNGTNLLVRDGGYGGVIVKIGSSFSDIKVAGDKIEAEAGALLKDAARVAMENSLTGFEFASGIPGSIGGAAFMNAGAYDSDMSQVIETVKLLSIDGSRIYTWSVEEMKYGYRKSRLMEEEAIIISVALKLAPGDKNQIVSKMKDLNDRRRQKQPLDYPSAGSFFKRPPGNYAGTLIQAAGLKGVSVGGAMVSPLHAGFII